MIYEEYQRFALWVHLTIPAVFICAGAYIVWAARSVDGLGSGFLCLNGGIFAVSALFLINVLELRTFVTSDEVYVRFGTWAPLIWKHIPLADIRDLRAVRYRPLRDAGGWGLRFGRFEGRPCRFYNARGNQGVLIDTPKRRYIIGSQAPERLAAAIAEARFG